VSDSWRGPASHFLIQLSQHPDGHWEFHEALSNALEPYRVACHEEAGMLDLEPLPTREDELVAEFRATLERLLADGLPVRIQKQMGDVFCEAIGDARSKHVRRAIKELYKGGKTSTNGVGTIQTMVVRPP
jgi:hypothetical protein